jgi:hypothetical protein
MDVQQKKTVEIPRGLFLVRYESADDTTNPPRVTVSLAPEHSEAIRVILPPGIDESVLWAPGACLVVRASQTGNVEIAVTPSQANGSVAAKIQLVPISNDPTGASASMVETVADVIDPSQMKIRGHVAGLGDVIVRPGEWIAGPSAPSRIEGLLLHWPNKPQSIDLRYSVSLGGPKPMQTPMVSAGTFAGTRGRALPLVGAVLELAGPQAARHQFEVEALFLGSPQIRITGRRIELSGPTGREPLVGLRVLLEEVGKKRLTVDQHQGQGKHPGQGRHEGQNKRVFRKKQGAEEVSAKAPIVRRPQAAGGLGAGNVGAGNLAEDRRKPFPRADKPAVPGMKKQPARVRVFQAEPKRPRPVSKP